MLAAAGFIVAAPVPGPYGLGTIELSLVGVVLALPPIAVTWWQNRPVRQAGIAARVR